MITTLVDCASFNTWKSITLTFNTSTFYFLVLFHITYTSVSHFLHPQPRQLPPSRRLLYGLEHMTLWTFYIDVSMFPNNKTSEITRTATTCGMHKTLTYQCIDFINNCLQRQAWKTEFFSVSVCRLYPLAQKPKKFIDFFALLPNILVSPSASLPLLS